MHVAGSSTPQPIVQIPQGHYAHIMFATRLAHLGTGLPILDSHLACRLTYRFVKTASQARPFMQLDGALIILNHSYAPSMQLLLSWKATRSAQQADFGDVVGARTTRTNAGRSGDIRLLTASVPPVGIVRVAVDRSCGGLFTQACI